MKRGLSSPSARTSARNAARQEDSKEDHDPDASLKEQPASGAGDAAADAGAVEPGQEEPTNYLVALAGMRALTSHVQDLSKGRRWTERVKGWEEKAGLAEPSVKLALGFLDILGVSRASVYKQLLENSLKVLLDKIPHLSEERMLLLLSDSFRFATLAELKSVPLKIISSMPHVPDNVLLKITDLQKNEPIQFEELGLPLAIKHLAWEKDAKLFERVVSPHAERYLVSEYSPKLVHASQQVRFYRPLDTTRRRKLMGPEGIDALAECTGGRPILIGYLCDYIADRFAATAKTSLSQAGLWATLLTDVLVTARERAYGSIADQPLHRLCALAVRLDGAVREDAFNDAGVRESQRLFREATGIGEERQDSSMADRREAELENAKRKDDSTNMQKTLKTAWALVSKMDKNKWFKDPVTEAIAEGYHKVIKTPMDLGTILKKIKGGGYPSFGDFDRDLKLMWKNCRTYNAEGTKYNAEALRQEQEWSDLSAKIEDDLRHQETRPATTTAIGTVNTTNKRKSSSSGGGGSSLSQDDARGSGGGAVLTPMPRATQLDRKGVGRRVGLASILLFEPFVAKLMYRHASERVPEACCRLGMLPRHHPVYPSLLQLLEQGEYAAEMSRAGVFGVREVEDRLTKTVLPCVVALHARAEAAVLTARRRGNAEPDADAGSAAADAAEKEDEAALASQDWKAWYKLFPAVRRMVCTMLCRALVKGHDEVTALLMPAAVAAAKKMADQRWLWASLGELLQGSAEAAAAPAGAKVVGGVAGVVGAAGKKGGKEKGSVLRVLKQETLLLILKLFVVGMESAAVSDTVFTKALELVAGLLPLASPPPPRSTVDDAAIATDNNSNNNKADKPEQLPPPTAVKGGGAAAGVAVVLPRSALEDVVNKAALRATRILEPPLTDAEELPVKEAFARVFAMSPPGWANKLAECRAKHEAKSKKGRGGGGDGGGKGGGGGGSGEGGSGGRSPRPISIKGPKREREDTAAGDEGGGRADAACLRKKSRRVDV